MNISIVVCTKDRPDDLRRLLKSLIIQNYAYQDVLIIDGSDNQVKDVVDTFVGSLPIRYWHVRPPGLTKQRNFGIANLNPDTEWVGFLDDDLELEPNCIVNLVNYLKSTPKIKGAGLRINDQRDLGKNYLREFMLIDSYPGGVVTKSGSAAPIRPYNTAVETGWLYGGATFWNKKVLEEFKFDEWFSGIGYCEDLDFSYRVAKKYNLAVCGEARCYHHHRMPGIEKMPAMGEWLVVAWWYFARVKNSFNILFVMWGIFWMSLNNLFIAIFKRDKKRFYMFKGNLNGWKKIFDGQILNSKGFQK
jgi:glycosyltransferase involved in cell wall biosynthesis